MIYRFSGLTLNTSKRQLSRDGEPIKLTQLSFDMLLVLVQAAPDLVSHEELMDRVWGPKRVVTPENLSQRIMMLRQSLGDDASNPIYIEGVHGQGFRFIPAVEVSSQSPGSDIQADNADQRPLLEPEATQSAFHAASAMPAPKGIPVAKWLLGVAVTLVLATLLFLLLLPDDADPGPASAGITGELPTIDLTHGPTVAVLPFVNMSSDVENEHFGDGIAEEIINTLVQQTNLPIIARTSSFQFKNQDIGGRLIGEKLGATHLLEGSIRTSGGKIRVTAQLIDSPTGYHLWSEQFDRAIDDLFEVQTEIASNIVIQIKRQLAAGGEQRVEDLIESTVGDPKISKQANEAYLKGIKHRERGLPDDIALALDYFETAVTLEPRFAEAWEARIGTQLAATEWTSGVSSYATAYKNIEEWLEVLLPELPDHPGLRALNGVIKAMYHYEWEEGLAEIEEVLPLLNDDPGVLTYLSTVYFWLGQVHRSIELAEQAVRLDPDTTGHRMALSAWYTNVGRQKEAAALLTEADVSYVTSMRNALTSFMDGRTTDMDRHLREAKQFVRHDHPAILSMESMLLSQMGEPEKAEALTKPLLDNMREQPVYLGYIEIPKDRQKEAYAIAEEQRQPIMLYWLINQGRNAENAPYYDKLRLDFLPDGKRGLTGLLTEHEREYILENEQPIPVSQLQQFVGTYKSGAQKIELSVVDGRLHHKRRYWAGPLSAVEQNVFISLVENDFEVKFLPNSEGVYDLCVWTSGQTSWYGYKQ